MSTTPSTSRHSRVILILAICFTVLAWASAFIFIRAVSPEIGGGALALGRLTVGTIALGVIVLVVRGWVRPSGREWLLLVVYGVAWFGGYNVMLNLGEHTLDAGTAAMIVGIGPILIALGAGIILGEGVPKWLIIGALVAFAGVVLIGLATSVLSGDAQPLDIVGVLWCLGAAVTYATGVIAQKPVVRRIPAAQATFLGCVIGFIVCLPFAGQLVGEVQLASPSALLGVVYLGVVPTALAFTTWAYALKRVPAGQLGIATYAAPPLAILMGWLFLGEVPAVLAIIGGALCLTGVALSRRRPQPIAHSPAEPPTEPAAQPAVSAAPTTASEVRVSGASENLSE